MLNLTVVLNETEPLSAERLQGVTDELASLEGVARQTQEQVDLLTLQVG